MCLYVALYSATYSAGKSTRGQARFFLIVTEISDLQRDFLLVN